MSMLTLLIQQVLRMLTYQKCRETSQTIEPGYSIVTCGLFEARVEYGK
jgi:hypothetical protein